MIIDKSGYRQNVGIILVNNKNHLFLGKRCGQDSWQFPQGGVAAGENAEEAMLRELREEIGLDIQDVKILGSTKHWLQYKLPNQYIRHDSKPLVIGQKQKWFLLRLLAHEQKIKLDVSNYPEFDSWRWVKYHEPEAQVIFFKKQVYAQALKELSCYIWKKRDSKYTKN